MNGQIARTLLGFVLLSAFLGTFVLLVAWASRRVGLDARNEVAPLLAGAGIIAAVALFHAKERSERRRKTLEVCEKLLLDKDLRTLDATVRFALASGTFQPDSDTRQRVGSHRHAVTILLNYLITWKAVPPV